MSRHYVTMVISATTTLREFIDKKKELYDSQVNRQIKIGKRALKIKPVDYCLHDEYARIEIILAPCVLLQILMIYGCGLFLHGF